MSIYRRFVHIVSEELPGVPTLDAISLGEDISAQEKPRSGCLNSAHSMNGWMQLQRIKRVEAKLVLHLSGSARKIP